MLGLIILIFWMLRFGVHGPFKESPEPYMEALGKSLRKQE